MATVVVDPGHGGTERIGGSSPNNAIGPNGTLEKTLTLDIALRLREHLLGRGHQVEMTRDSDVNLGLRERAAFSKRSGAPVFVSIHFNASNDHSAQGTETFVHVNHLPVSATLCRAVQPRLVAATGLKDRNATHGGVKRQELGVLRMDHHGARTAAILVEVSFLDRADEEERLEAEGYKDAIAKALSDGVSAYLGSGVRRSLAGAVELEDGVAISAWEASVSPEALAASSGAAGTRGDRAAPEMRERRINDIAERLTRELSETAADDAGELAHEPAPDAFAFSPLDSDRATVRDLLRARFSAVALESFDYEGFDAFVKTLGLRYFTSVELLFMGASNASGDCRGTNSLPPESLWPNIAATAQMLDAIRERLGAPIRILSAYRNETYNRCVGGERKSLHTRFNAIDWTCQKGEPERWRDVARKIRSGDPAFMGGVGFYPGKRFIHIDTRGGKADWTG